MGIIEKEIAEEDEYLAAEERRNKPFYEIKQDTLIEIKGKKFFVYEKNEERVDFGHGDMGWDSYVFLAPVEKSVANLKKMKRYSPNYNSENKLPPFKLLGKASSALVVKLVKTKKKDKA